MPRIAKSTRVTKRLREAVAAGVCCNYECKSIGDERAVSNRGLCVRCANAFRYECTRLVLRQGHGAARAYEVQRIREGSLMAPQAIRDYKRDVKRGRK